MADDRPRSWEVTEGPQPAPARAMLRAVGFSEEDFGKSQIAVASSWNEVTPCMKIHLQELAAVAKEGVRQGAALSRSSSPRFRVTPTVSRWAMRA